MSWTKVVTGVAIFVWVVSCTCLYLFNRSIMRPTPPLQRKPTQEEMDAIVDRLGSSMYSHYEAHLRAYQARVEKFNQQVRSMTPSIILGVSPTATQDEIKAAYRRLAMKHHPDRGGDVDEFQKIKAAYEQLMKPTRCPDCEGKGTIKVKRGAFVDTVQCPRCWPQGGT